MGKKKKKNRINNNIKKMELINKIRSRINNKIKKNGVNIQVLKTWLKNVIMIIIKENGKLGGPLDGTGLEVTFIIY